MLPSILAKQLQQGIKDYLRTTFPMTNEPFKGSLENMLNTKDAIYHEPYISIRLPFRTADTMPDCFEAVEMKFMPHMHQTKAFNRLVGEDGRSTLIATGTGSGKTECFLYPILEYCYQHKETPGIKALIIYPMNALATDQAKRIADLIAENPKLKGTVTAGMYVGGRDNDAAKAMKFTFDANGKPVNKIITDRQALLDNPPDILLTNYKMLDYLLVRPKDAKLWKDNKPDTLRYIAVDELHTFDGAQGTDLACLLRRLKSRLWIRNGYLCCIGTSATMGSKSTAEDILRYAEEIFGESFDSEAVVTEDRISAQEFFDGFKEDDFTIPTNEEVSALADLINEGNEEEYIKYAASIWLDNFAEDVLSPSGRLSLALKLKCHNFFQGLLSLMNGKFCQLQPLYNDLERDFPGFRKIANKEDALNALIALVSHARTGDENHLRPFLHVQVQVWMRELRRLMGSVNGKEIHYSLYADLNSEQRKHYLPVFNCRTCGATAWATRFNQDHNAIIKNMTEFYSLFFGGDEHIKFLYPYSHEHRPNYTRPALVCPACMAVYDESARKRCECGCSDLIEVVIPTQNISIKQSKAQYRCPFCSNHDGVSLMGIRSSTAISADISQIFASKFNDDKKTLAFSDSVQDAAHRAGFFNSRTWRFGLRSAIQKYVDDGGAGKSFKEFNKEFIEYWHKKLSSEDFVGYFVAPNMVWMSAYEELKDKGVLGSGQYALDLKNKVDKRTVYEIMLEYGLTSRIGRTLEKSGASMLMFACEDIDNVAEQVYSRAVNELGMPSSMALGDFKALVWRYLNTMRQNGAFVDAVFQPFIDNNGNDFMLSQKHIPWMPGQQYGRNIPKFLTYEGVVKTKKSGFDGVGYKKYRILPELCIGNVLMSDTQPEDISRIVLEELEKAKLVIGIPVNNSEKKVYGIDRGKVYVTNEVCQAKCNICGASVSVPRKNLEYVIDTPCANPTCQGCFSEDTEVKADYYGKLYRLGDLSRINAQEHNGLLERNKREALERNFKKNKKDTKFWDPNVLSCTPTLEMGIDIGDLSTVILCSMPPAQAQFLQRAGRGGRTDGNALTLAVANSRAHDLYFYADPMDMIAGEVEPPKIFLNASAVLQRQFIGYCMDAWVAKGAKEEDIPKHVGNCLDNIKENNGKFPYNFLDFVQGNVNKLFNSFVEMFSKYMEHGTKEELETFAFGKGLGKSPMHVRVYDVFKEVLDSQATLKENIDELQKLIKEKEAGAQDSSYEEEIKELNAELRALYHLYKETRKQSTFNFLSDSGLLPNYAFPEEGVTLKAVLRRAEQTEDEDRSSRKVEKLDSQYSRAASSAISELAPNNTFYIDGHKLKIDQIDVKSSKIAKWRLCPKCSHVELETANLPKTCPRCHNSAWADNGQVRNMLQIKTVYCNAKYAETLIGDDSDDRATTFYRRQLLVDVDETKDIVAAYRIGDEKDIPFGYEFDKNASLREINFGEFSEQGEVLAVAGEEDVRKGFKVCKHCGKIQTGDKPQHTSYCITNKVQEENPYEECLFLYRDFTTEILRVLIPSNDLESMQSRTESFVSAFMLGMRKYFGNVDHLRYTIVDVPVEDAEFRNQYLVVYDSVPGGTGYLKQLLNNKDAFMNILEAALEVLENCSCQDDPQKDGCYHCLYAYRQSKSIGNISRNTAITLLKRIIKVKDKIKPVPGIRSIHGIINPLESMFIDNLSRLSNSERKISLDDIMINGKHGFKLHIAQKNKQYDWIIEPQVTVNEKHNVMVQSLPDFMFRPTDTRNGLKPVAVFTDGFKYHKDIVQDDILKREAIIQSGNYRVWSLSWNDIIKAQKDISDYAASTLVMKDMPGNLSKLQQDIKKKLGNISDKIIPTNSNAYELLIDYLTSDDGEAPFIEKARLYSGALLNVKNLKNAAAFKEWNEKVEKLVSAIGINNLEFKFGDTVFSAWQPKDGAGLLNVYTGLKTSEYNQNKMAKIYCFAYFNDQIVDEVNFQKTWNGLLQFMNVMQFSEGFVAIPESDPECLLGIISDTSSGTGKQVVTDDGWNEIIDSFEDEVVTNYIEKLRVFNVPVADDFMFEEFETESSAVEVSAVLVWLDKKIAVLWDYDMENRSVLEELGWKVLNIAEDIPAGIFGGEA